MSTVLLSVGDASGDPYAAALVRALSTARPGTHFVGLAGDATQDAGAELVAHQHSIAIGGIVELAGSLGRIARSWRALQRVISRQRPDLAILIDTADFNIPLARQLQRARVPVLYYVLPQVWAWRRGRIRKLAERSDRLAVIFPFEVAEYARAGVTVEYVGHPLIDAIRDFRPAEAGHDRPRPPARGEAGRRRKAARRGQAAGRRRCRHHHPAEASRVHPRAT